MAEAFCFEVRTEDLAGNPGPRMERCLPCRDQLYDPGQGFISVDFPAEGPSYSNHSIYPGGYCPDFIEDPDADPSTTTGSDDGPSEAWTTGSDSGEPDGEALAEPADGCGCRAVGGSWPVSYGLWLCVLLVVRRRDRSAG